MKRAFLLAALAGLTLVAEAGAQTYPDRPVHLVVPYDTGGITDLIARQVGRQLSEAIGQPVVIENRKGATGLIGVQYVAEAAADGYTLLYDSLTQRATAAALDPSKEPYNLAEDFIPVAVVATSPRILAVTASVPATTLPEFIAFAKESQSPVSYSSSGIGSVPHLAGELLQKKAGITMKHVPYSGAAASVSDMVAGFVQVTITSPVTLMPHIEVGKVKAIAAASDNRLPELPDVQTFEEGGVSDFDVSSLYGVFAPSGTPQDVVEKLNAELMKITESDDFKKAAREQGGGSLALTTTLSEASEMMVQEYAKWADAAIVAGLQK